MISIILSSLSLFAASAHIGFSEGNEITVQPLEGYAYANCNDSGGGTRYETVYCYGSDVDPGLRDYFVIEGVVADKVELVARQENGKTVKKTSKFLTDKARSKSTFNLLINTVFQRALLAQGSNQVDFHLTKDKASVVKGSFTARVNVLPTKYCRAETLPGRYDCNNRTRLCDDYFYYNRECK